MASIKDPVIDMRSPQLRVHGSGQRTDYLFDGERFQIHTYGRASRDHAQVPSQSIQLDAREMLRLRNLLTFALEDF